MDPGVILLVADIKMYQRNAVNRGSFAEIFPQSVKRPVQT